jgi:uncharacterized protein YndB with AHSA1/START domain
MAETNAIETPMNDTSMKLVADREIVIGRTFRAPARIVFDAWTKPEFVRRWWAPTSRGVTLVQCDADVRAGGKYRYVLEKDGTELGFSGAYKEVTPHSRLVYNQIFEPAADGSEGAIITVTFEERDGKTKLVARELYPSKEIRDIVIASGMEGGMRETMNQLDALVASIS